MAVKNKTKSGAKKRFKKTANGYKHRRAFRSHILTKRKQKPKRKLRSTKLIHESDVKMVERMLGDA